MPFLSVTWGLADLDMRDVGSGWGMNRCLHLTADSSSQLLICRKMDSGLPTSGCLREMGSVVLGTPLLAKNPDKNCSIRAMWPNSVAVVWHLGLASPVTIL